MASPFHVYIARPKKSSANGPGTSGLQAWDSDSFALGHVSEARALTIKLTTDIARAREFDAEQHALGRRTEVRKQSYSS